MCTDLARVFVTPLLNDTENGAVASAAAVSACKRPNFDINEVFPLTPG